MNASPANGVTAGLIDRRRTRPSWLSPAKTRVVAGGRELDRTRVVPWTTVIFLAVLFAFHAAASGIPGRAYFYLLGLNDISVSPGINILLQPAIVWGCAFLMYRSMWSKRDPVPRPDAITAGLVVWLVGATLAAIANIETPQVILTYCTVFVAGAVVYVAISGVKVTETLVDVVFVSLAVGALVPLLAGIAAYVKEWGVPDWKTLMTATQDVARMGPYEAATFGNRGNMAAFLVIVSPPVLWLALDAKRPLLLRLLYAGLLVPLALNLLLIEVRAALITLVMTASLVWRFRSASRVSYVVFGVACVVVLTTIITKIPEVGDAMSQRFDFLLTLDTGDDASLIGRTEAIEEGVDLAKKNWAFGVGPGGALTAHSQTAAHQVHVQQAMETGVIGLLGCILTTVATFTAVFAAIGSRKHPPNRLRFVLVIGPFAFLLYGLLANLTLNIGYVNTWTVLVLGLLGLSRETVLRSRTAASPLSQAML